MPDTGLVKYLVRLKFEVEGVVEKADLIGAIFGQTEGLFGPEMNLHELQKSWKVGRIEVNLSSRNGRTEGEVIIPMSTDISTASLIAAAVESIDKVGPCQAHLHLSAIEDVRATKRKAIAERAKSIMKNWASKTSSEGEELLKDISESTKKAKLVTFGREELPAGPGVYTSDTVIVVEGRADVLNLFRAGYENVVAVEGTKIPESVMRLSREKKVIAFLDGDRAGDLILKELEQVARIERVIRAPSGKEVEDLTSIEIIELLKQEARPVEEARPPAVKIEIDQALLGKVKELYPSINGSLEAELLDAQINSKKRVPISGLIPALEAEVGTAVIVFDGIVTQRLADSCEKTGVKSMVAHRIGDLKRRPESTSIYLFRDLGLE